MVDTNKFSYQISLMNEEISSIRNKHSTIIRQMMIEDFDSLRKQYSGLDKVFIRGYTPAWNDGEECTHRHQVFVNNSGEYSDVSEFYEIVIDRDFDYSDIPEHIKKINSKLSKDDCKRVQAYFNDMDDTMEASFGTNWYMIIDFTTEEVTIDFHDDYDCGY